MTASYLEVSYSNDGKVVLSRKCPFCGNVTSKEMDAKEYEAGIEKYMNGCILQNAFPSIDASTRELIHTGICDKCWNSL